MLIALHFVYYNFVKIHKTLRAAPSIEAGLIKRLMNLEDSGIGGLSVNH
jgi:hypothetical protein